jgi:hypothetical protein
MADDKNVQPPKDGTPPTDPPATPPADPPKDGAPTVKDDDVPPVSTPPTPPADPSGDDGKKDDPPSDDAIRKVVKSEMAPVADSLHTQRIENEIQKILTENPEYKPYEKRIRNFVTHENRKGLIKQGLPVQAVVVEAVAPYMQEIGAARAKAADEKADKTKSAGSSTTPTETPEVDLSKMKNVDVTNMSEQIKSGRFKK